MKLEKQQRARQLRQRGMSITTIAKQLEVAKSSVFVWVEDIELTQSQKDVLNKNISTGLALSNERVKRERVERHRKFRLAGYERAKTDSKFRTMCAIYWGEGSKGRNVFSVANADTTLLRVVVMWLKDSGYDNKISLRLHYYLENGLTDTEIAAHWLDALTLQNTHLRKSIVCRINRASQHKKIGRLPYGTGHLEVCSTELIQQIYGGIEFLKTGNW